MEVVAAGTTAAVAVIQVATVVSATKKLYIMHLHVEVGVAYANGVSQSKHRMFYLFNDFYLVSKFVNNSKRYDFQ